MFDSSGLIRCAPFLLAARSKCRCRKDPIIGGSLLARTTCFISSGSILSRRPMLLLLSLRSMINSWFGAMSGGRRTPIGPPRFGDPSKSFPTRSSSIDSFKTLGMTLLIQIQARNLFRVGGRNYPTRGKREVKRPENLLIIGQKLRQSHVYSRFSQPEGNGVPYFYKIDKEYRLVISAGAGVLTKGEILGLQDRLLADSEFDPSFAQLINLTQVTGVEGATADGVQEVTERSIFSLKSRRAVIANSDLIYGLSRMFQIFRELKGDQGIRVFRSLEEGLDWIAGRD